MSAEMMSKITPEDMDRMMEVLRHSLLSLPPFPPSLNAQFLCCRTQASSALVSPTCKVREEEVVGNREGGRGRKRTREHDVQVGVEGAGGRKEEESSSRSCCSKWIAAGRGAGSSGQMPEVTPEMQKQMSGERRRRRGRGRRTRKLIFYWQT
eukprot:1783-Hanusia_phi.AAC.1